ncbi:branched-chain amino acid ABC transporter permease [Blastococcus sp. SYSU D00820]
MLQSSISGLVSGGVYAAIGVCIVLLYSMVGVLNFAQAAIGVAGAYVTFILYAQDLPLVLAVLVGVVVAAAVATLTGTAMALWFGEARVEVRSTASIAVLIGILAVGFWVFGDDARATPDVLPASGPEVAGVVIPGTAIGAIAFAVLLAGGVTLLLKRTVVGVRLRAIAQRPRTAELLGIPARRLSVAVWALSGAAACIAILLVAPSRTASVSSLSLLVVPGLAAGLIGGFTSLWLTVLGGLLIGLLEGAIVTVDEVAPYRGSISFLVIVLVLLYSKRKEAWDASR